jgi:GWxTD domain-containing protein
MRIYRITAALLILLTTVSFGRPHDELRESDPSQRDESLSSGRGPVFRCQIGQRLGDGPDSLRLYVAISVPNDNLSFLRGEDGGYVATFEYSVALFAQDTLLPIERVQTIDVTAESFRQTNSRTQHAFNAEEFTLPPGEYRIRVTVADEETRRESRWRGEVKLEQSDPLLDVSDIFWVSSDERLRALGMPRLVNSFPTSESQATARVEFYSIGDAQLRLFWGVFDDAGDTLRHRLSNAMPTGKMQSSEYTVLLEGLPPQSYTLYFEVDGNGRRETRSLEFSVHLPGIPASITDLGIAIRQVKYIATVEENRRLRNASISDRARLFREFWKKRDPDPATEENELMQEYYYRVEYSDEHFSTHRNGWETDRGRIYILYGEPTQIERHPFESGTYPYEIWYYHHINRRFVFVDHTGFGDYTLAGPQWGY